MDVTIGTLKKIFEPDRRHVVPMFQRPYVWGAELQWKPLWDDVINVAERIQRKEEVRPHFLGAIVLEQVKQPISKVETRLVVDGQQRLTTLQLLLEAASDLCRARGWDKYHRAFFKLTRNEDPLSTDRDDVYKVWPTNADQEAFRTVMDARSADTLRKTPLGKANTSAIANAYLFFSDAISLWLEEGGGNGEQQVEHLYTALREKLHIVVIDLGDADDPQMIFETLNARGTPLLPADLIKNTLFYRARQASAGVERLHQLHWKHLDDGASYWRTEVAAGRVRRSRIDLFLQHFLAMESGDEVPVGHLYAAFRGYLGRSSRTVEEHLEALAKYSRVFRRFDEFDRRSRVGMFLSRLEDLEVTTAHPLLLHLFSLELSAGDLEACVIAVESFLVRRLVCHLTTKNYNRLFLDALNAVKNSGGDVPGALRQHLLSGTGDSVKWPSDREVGDAWLVMPTYRIQARRRTRMLLEALELASRGPKQEAVDLQRKLTIEHLLPQDWREHWPLEPGADPIQAGADRDRILHTIGNLTLLTKALNPSASNGPWSHKRQKIQESLLMLNKQVVDIPAWNEEAIRTRGSRLLALALELWPRPSQPDSRDVVTTSYLAVGSALMGVPPEVETEGSTARRIGCPIPGCGYAFKNATLGWDGHVGQLKKHPEWHPDIQSPAERRRLFREEFPQFGAEDPGTATVGREYWERKADPRALAVVDECARLIEAAGLTVRWSHAKGYIALGGARQQFAWFRPQRTGPKCRVKIKTEADRRDDHLMRLQASGLRLGRSSGSSFRVHLVTGDVTRHAALLQELLESAFRRSTG
jgi:hypothetical protein